ncbi:MAG: hypothetical protein RJA98_1426 [Pseudomonadota bacterium]|jgi:uncharacterized membrane protein
MLYALLKTLHLLSVIVWLGGMFFVLSSLRPALAVLQGPQRLQLMQAVLKRFFKIVLVAASVIVLTGGAMIGRLASASREAGLPFNMPLELHAMTALGVLMLLIFGHIRFVLYKRMNTALAGNDTTTAGGTLDSIRLWVSVNLTLGVVIVVTTLLGSAL